MSQSKNEPDKVRRKKADVMDYTGNGQEKYLHMNNSKSFTNSPDYDYLQNTGARRVFVNVVRAVVWFLLEIIDHLAFGIKINGKDNLEKLSGSAVIVCNHVHPMDCTFSVLPIFPSRTYYMTLESNFKIPVIRHIIHALLAVPISRNPFRLKEMLDSMKTALQDGSFVVIYPEGELSPYCKKLRPFKNGAFKLAVSANVPVLPMTVTYRRPRGLFRLFKRKPCLSLNILPPISPDFDGTDRQKAEQLKNECFYNMNEFINN